MSSLFITIGDYEEADKLLKTILDKYPNFGPAWNNKAIIHANRKEWADAATCMAKAEENGFDVPEDFKKEVEANI
jgi:tetratricopeptide (TPR) repeat protein